MEPSDLTDKSKSITSFMLISVSSFSTDKRLKQFHFCALLLQCSDFNCGFQRVFSLSQHEFEPYVSEFVHDSANRVGAASMLAVVVEFNSVTNKRQKQFEPST